MNTIDVSQKSAVMTITLNNPDKGNALSDAMVGEINDALDSADKSADDGDVALVIFQSAGKHFCTGFDLSDLADVNDDVLLSRLIRIEMLLARVWSARYVTLAMAKGRTFGAGADLLAACDRRFGQVGASFSFPGAAFGLVLGSRRLGQRIGLDVAQEVILSGRRLSDAESRDLGLLSGIVDGQEAIDTLLEAEALTAKRLAEVTRVQLRQVLGDSQADLDADLGNLVRSAVRPGLKKRIEDYRAQMVA